MHKHKQIEFSILLINAIHLMQSNNNREQKGSYTSSPYKVHNYENSVMISFNWIGNKCNKSFLTSCSLIYNIEVYLFQERK